MNKLFLAFSIILVFASLAFWHYFGPLQKHLSSVDIVPQFEPLIFTDENQFVEVSGFGHDQIVQSVINTASASNTKKGGIEGIYLTTNKRIVGFKELLSLIGGSITSQDADPISDNFLIGALNNDTKDVFILLKVRSFADVFPILRLWEKKMFFDLHGFFGPVINADTNYLFTKDFEDGIIGNKNARVLYDKDGNIAMAYIFANDNSVIITSSSNAAREVMNRLSSSQVGK